MKRDKTLFFLILGVLLLILGIVLKGYDFVHIRASTVCLSCMGFGG
ncbi:MAG: hypothetical protein GXO57_05845 [Thermodesulfobacteria bacterium]|nr:hypothetical protein [Thermodesulfobacteriota bacterium]